MPMRRSVPWQQLSRSITRPLLLGGEEQFDTLRRPATNRYQTARPQAIARCASPTDVVQVINFCRRYGLEIAVRGAGHSFAGHSSTTGLLIETGLMCAVAVEGDLATIGAGARLAGIYRALHDHQAAIAAGCGPTVGIAGLALGGGLGVLGRTYGLTCDRMIAAQVVLADGSLIACDDTSDSDLYWALRGAGAGNFGVVTALTFRTIPEPQALAFHLRWLPRGMPEAMNAWMDWAPSAPDAMAASLVVRAPADPSVSPQVHLIGSVLADDAAATDGLGHFERLVGAPVRYRQLPMAPISEVKAQLAAFGAEIGAGSATAVDHSASEFHRQRLPTAVTAALALALNADRIPGQAREFAFTPLGGAYNRVSADATAFVHRSDEFLLEYTVTSDSAQPAASPRAGTEWLGQIRELLNGYGTGRAYQNFAGPELTDPLRAYYGQNLSRLGEVKRHYDPDNFFHHGQSVPPTADAMESRSDKQ
jgi:FAD/FMN-containing dehydrogenase